MTAAALREPAASPEQRPPADLPVIPDIPLMHRRGPDGRDLVVAFSPTGRFALSRTAFPCDALHVADKTGLYYVTRAAAIARALIDLVEREGYRRVLLMGSSKGGFGALVVARTAARMRRDRVFRVLAFSPQIRLYPGNPDLYFPSYRRMRALAARSPALAWDLRRFGDMSAIGDEPNVATMVLYGAGNAADCAEARRVRGPNAVARPLPASAHSLLVYIKLRNRPAETVRVKIAKLYAKARQKGQEQDRDLFASRPADPEQMVREIVDPSAPWPGLDDLIAEAFEATPRPIAGAEARQALLRRARLIVGLGLAAVRGWPKARRRA